MKVPIFTEWSKVYRKIDLWFQRSMTWGIWWIFAQNLKVWKSHFDGLFLPKVYGVWNKKNKGVIFHDTEQWCKIWINPDLVVSKMAWGIGWTFIRALKNLKNCTLTGSFCQKHIIIQLENSREILCHDTEGKLTCGLKNDIRNLVNFHASHWKSENLHFDRNLLHIKI